MQTDFPLRTRPSTCDDIRVQVRHLYISAGHNFFGRHGHPPGTHPMVERDSIECFAGRGIAGDRFLDRKPGYKGQITFFAEEIYEILCDKLNIRDKAPSVFRRNVITAGVDLNKLIGKEFEIQGVLFRGTEESTPCYWMNHAFGRGAEELLRGNGGLRAVILTDGALRIDKE